jgi:hypothetical protein
MNFPSYKNATRVLISLTILIVIGKCYMLNKIKFNIDIVENQIQPIESKIPINTHIGFDSNLTGYERFSLYLASKYIITPKILLYQTDLDTLLTIQDKSKAIIPQKAFRTICRIDEGNSVVSLVVKIR